MPLYLTPIIVYLLLTITLTYPLISNLAGSVPNDIGDPLLNTWILAWDTHALLTDPLNLFNANIFQPLPNTLAYSEHLFSTALLALPLQLISGEPIVAYNLSLLATFPLAAFGMYLLTLRWTGRRSAAFIGGLIFGFAPYRFAAIAHLQLLTFQWLPFTLLFFDLLLHKSPVTGDRSPITARRLLALAIFLLLQILASWYLAIYTVLILGIYLAVALLARRLSRALVIKLALLALGTGLLTWPFVRPYLALVNDLHQARPLTRTLSLAARPADFAAAAPFNLLFGPLTSPLRARSGFTEEQTLFVGVLTPLLALVPVAVLLAASWGKGLGPPTTSALFIRFDEGRPRFLAILTLLVVVALSLTLTLPTPYAILGRLLPFSTVVRVPARWIIPALFALAALAAGGYALIDNQIQTGHRRQFVPRPRLSFFVSLVEHHRQAIFMAVCTTLLLIETLSIPLPLAFVDNRANLDPVYQWLARQPAGFNLIELPLHSAPAPEFPEVKRLYASTLGWWPLVNGYSGYTPARQPRLAQRVAGFPHGDSVPALQTLAETLQAAGRPLYLLIHPGEAPLDRTQWETGDRWSAERNPALLPLGQFEGDYLYQILPPLPDRFSGRPLATFGPNHIISLKAVQFSPPRSTPSPQLILFWQPTSPIPTGYTVFIHLRAGDGFVRNQADGPPVSNQYPTTAWQPGEIIQDIHPLPHADFSQIDHVAIGLYEPNTGRRLPAFDPDGIRLTDGAVIIPISDHAIGKN